MEVNENYAERTIRIKVSELMKKFRHKEDRYNFNHQRSKSISKIYSNKFQIFILIQEMVELVRKNPKMNHKE